MKSTTTSGWVLLICLLTSGCVSTTTGSTREGNNKDAAELNYQLGARYFRNGKYELARDRLLQSIDFDSSRAVTYTTLALTYEQLDNLRLATETYKKAVRVAPRDFNVQNAYAVFLCRQGEYGQAKTYFDKAIAVNENDFSEITMTNAGMCMARKPDAELAESYFRQALDRRSNYPEALLQMSLLKHHNEDSLGARAFLQRYLSVNEPSASVLFLGVQIEKALGDDRARREYSKQLLSDFPDSPEARRVLSSNR